MMVPRQFADDFDRVVAHYRCPPEEVELMRECVRADLESAVRCFRLLAREISDLQGQPPGEPLADASFSTRETGDS